MKYEIFHRGTKVQRKIIRKRNFTYRIHLSILSKYLFYNERVLDVGCGSGSVSFYVASMGNKVVGIDISQKAIGICNETSKLLGLTNFTEFKVADCFSFKSREKFDFIIVIEVLEHLEEDERAIERFSELLNKNGKLFISVPSKNSPLFKLGISRNFDKEVGHLRRYSTKGLEGILEQRGFEILETCKVEGILRNFLFLNPIAKNFVRFIKGPLSDLVTFIDNLTVSLFGESDIIVVARKK